MHNLEKPPKWLIKYFIILLAISWLSFYFVSILKSLSDLFLILLVSLLIAAAVEQPVSKLVKKGMRRGFATGLTLSVLIFAIVIIIFAGSSIFLSQYQELKESLPGQLINLSIELNKLGFNLNYQDLNNSINSFFQDSVIDNTSLIISNLLKVLISSTIALFLIFYLVADGPKIRRTLCSLLPQSKQESFLSIWEEATKKAGGFFLVRSSMALYATIISFIFFFIIELPYALPLAVWVGIISQLIPAIGTYLAALLPITIGLSYAPDKILIIIIFLIIYQQFENYILTPKLSKNMLQIHPAIAFFSALIGAIIAGFIGALIAIPFVATMQAFISSFFERYPLIESKHLQEDEIKSVKLLRKKYAKNKNKKNKL